MLLRNGNKSTALRISACHLGFEANVNCKFKLATLRLVERKHEEVFGLLLPSHFFSAISSCVAMRFAQDNIPNVVISFLSLVHLSRE